MRPLRDASVSWLKSADNHEDEARGGCHPLTVLTFELSWLLKLVCCSRLSADSLGFKAQGPASARACQPTAWGFFGLQLGGCSLGKACLELRIRKGL